MNKLLSSLSISLLLAGCYSTAPHKNLDAQGAAVGIENMSGIYRTRDSRQNKYSRIAAIDVLILPKRGNANIQREDGSSYKLVLWKCEPANIAQAQNFGKPFEAVESLVRCDILSNYKYTAIYVGMVKSGYAIGDQKMFKTFEPMQISTGYVISLKEDLASEVWLGVTKE